MTELNVDNLGDITSIIERHNQFYERQLADLTQEDKIPSYFRDDKNKGSIKIVFAQMLWIDKGCIPWEKLIVRHQNPKDYINEILEKIGLHRFKDEDAEGFGLVITEDEYGKKAICFVNPDFPEGWWENHTLDGKLR